MPRIRLSQNEGVLRVPQDTDKRFVTWTIGNVMAGFKLFYKETGRWPTHNDCDVSAFLPNVRTIERKFGGMKEVRKLLGITDYDLSRGESRSKIAKMIGERGHNFENWLEQLLVKRFQEPFVHVQSRSSINEPIKHKKWVQRSQNVDFLVYYKDGKFAVDTYYPSEIPKNFLSNTRAKVLNYRQIDVELFLVIGNEKVSRELIGKATTMAFRLTNNRLISIYTVADFLEHIKGYEPIDAEWIDRA